MAISDKQFLLRFDEWIKSPRDVRAKSPLFTPAELEKISPLSDELRDFVDSDKTFLPSLTEEQRAKVLRRYGARLQRLDAIEDQREAQRPITQDSDKPFTAKELARLKPLTDVDREDLKDRNYLDSHTREEFDLLMRRARAETQRSNAEVERLNRKEKRLYRENRHLPGMEELERRSQEADEALEGGDMTAVDRFVDEMKTKHVVTKIAIADIEKQNALKGIDPKGPAYQAISKHYDGLIAALAESLTKPSPPTKPVDPNIQEEERVRLLASRKRAADHRLSLLEQEMKDVLAVLDPNSEEYRRRRADWVRLIEEERRKE